MSQFFCILVPFKSLFIFYSFKIHIFMFDFEFINKYIQYPTQESFYIIGIFSFDKKARIFNGCVKLLKLIMKVIKIVTIKLNNKTIRIDCELTVKHCQIISYVLFANINKLWFELYLVLKTNFTKLKSCELNFKQLS